MNNADYKLGQLDQFKQDICNRVDKLESSMIIRWQDMTVQISRLEQKIDKNRVWRIKTIGFASGVSATISSAITLLTLYWKLK